MLFSKLRRVWSHNDINNIPGFREAFPELKHLSSEELCDRFQGLEIDFYTVEQVPVSWWVRLSLPFAILAWVGLLVGLPFAFLLTGRWGYSLDGKCWLMNWFRAVFP